MSTIPRKYDSSARRQKAANGRRAIVAAARKLFIDQGYFDTTIDKIAREAGCASPTVYATFTSKARILAALLEEASFGSVYEARVQGQKELLDPAERLRSAAGIARTIFEAEHAEVELLLRGAAIVAPEIAAMERQREQGRFEKQKPLIDFLASHKRLKSGLTVERARHILWALTSRDLFRLLVQVQSWPPSDYEGWLGAILVDQLLEPAANPTAPAETGSRPEPNRDHPRGNLR